MQPFLIRTDFFLLILVLQILSPILLSQLNIRRLRFRVSSIDYLLLLRNPRSPIDFGEEAKILDEDRLKPDAEDKDRESELIVRPLRIEKNAKMAARQTAKAEKTEKFREAEAQTEFAQEKKKLARSDLRTDELPQKMMPAPQNEKVF